MQVVTSLLLPKPNVFKRSHLVARFFCRSFLRWCYQVKRLRIMGYNVNITKVCSSSLAYLSPHHPHPFPPLLPYPPLCGGIFATRKGGEFIFGLRENEKRFINITNIRCNEVCTLKCRTTNYPGDLVQTLGSDMSSPRPSST